MSIEELITNLESNPEDWDTRCAISQAYYDAEQYEEAAQVISEAPEIPFDEENVIFASTIIGTADPDAGHGLLDQYIESEPTEAAYELKAQLYDMVGDEENAAACRAALSGEVEEEAVVEEEVAEPETVAPVVPTSLRPPGEEDEAVDTEEVFDAEGEEVYAADGGEAAAGLAFEGADGAPAALVVGEGEAVYGVEAKSNTNDKMGAIIAAVIVHVVIILLLGLVLSPVPRPNPPQITASAVANSDEPSIENKTLTKQTQKSAAAVSSAQPVVSSMAFSSFAMPDMPDMMNDLSMPAMSDSDAGFGMSMSGFGDVSNMGAIPASMRSRCSMSERMKRLRESGGEDRAERGVRKGLDYLTSQQDRETGAVGKVYTAGMTGLTLLAYLGHCETPESPKYGDSVVKAALYLMDRGIKNKGLLTNGESGHHEAYEHAIATYALAELYTMTKESGKEIPRLESVLRKAVDIIIDKQHDIGGWSYLKGGHIDMSVSGWNIQALKAAYNTGKGGSKVERALDKAVQDYLPKTQDESGAFKYRPEDPKGKPSLTGAAMLAMQIWDEMGSGPYNKALSYLNKAYQNPSPSPGGHGMYDEYYNTQAYFMHGGEDWEKYNKVFQPKLLDSQQADGSWKMGDPAKDGVIMNTAWAVLTLEVYYRYLPTTDKVKDLKVR